MKYIAAFVLFGLSLLLGVIASLNIYFALATMGKSQLRVTPNYVMMSVFAVFAVVLFAGGVAVLFQRPGKS